MYTKNSSYTIKFCFYRCNGIMIYLKIYLYLIIDHKNIFLVLNSLFAWLQYHQGVLLQWFYYQKFKMMIWIYNFIFSQLLPCAGPCVFPGRWEICYLIEWCFDVGKGESLLTFRNWNTTQSILTGDFSSCLIFVKKGRTFVS